MGSGGGGSTTTTTGIPEWARPYLEESLAEAQRTYRAGELSQVATLPEQGLAEQEKLARKAIEGTGIYDTSAAAERQLRNLQGQQMAGAAAAGALGSARSERAMQSALADKAFDIAQTRKAEAAGGVSALRDVDTARQAELQKQLDLPYTGLSRVFGFYGSPAVGTTQQTSDSGGK